MVINIIDCQKKIEIEKSIEDLIRKAIETTLKLEEVNINAEVCVIIVDNKEIRDINLKQRGIDKSTDCLSFPMLSYKNKKVFKEMYSSYTFKEHELYEGRVVLGDIALSAEMALQQSEEFCHSFEREVCYLVVHSLLHLLGYDHIIEEDKIRMRKREKEIMKKMKLYR